MGRIFGGIFGLMRLPFLSVAHELSVKGVKAVCLGAGKRLSCVDGTK